MPSAIENRVRQRTVRLQHRGSILNRFNSWGRCTEAFAMMLGHFQRSLKISKFSKKDSAFVDRKQSLPKRQRTLRLGHPWRHSKSLWTLRKAHKSIYDCAWLFQKNFENFEIFEERQCLRRQKTEFAKTSENTQIRTSMAPFKISSDAEEDEQKHSLWCWATFEDFRKFRNFRSNVTPVGDMKTEFDKTSEDTQIGTSMAPF